MKRKMPKGRPFQKGQSGNPSGVSPLERELRDQKLLNREKFRELSNLLFSATHEEAQRILDNPNTTLLTLGLIQVIMNICANGDMHSLDKLLDRLIGKPKTEIDVHSDGPSVRHEHIIALVKELNASAEKQDKENA